MADLPLFDDRPLDTTPAPPAMLTMAERAAWFHLHNPHVMRMAVDLARHVKAKGLTRYSMKAIWEVLRFRAIESHGDKYKLNNSYTAWYARAIMCTYPDLQGFLVTRECPHDEDYHTKEQRP